MNIMGLDENSHDEEKKVEFIMQNQPTEDKSQELNLTQDIIPLPYKSDKCSSLISYKFKSFLVTNDRLLSLGLLYTSVGPRILSLVDIYTDIQVAIDLYNGKYTALFGLSLIFISFSFIMLWSVSLRFIDKIIDKTQQSSIISNLINHSRSSKIIFDILLVLYLFPPFGCLAVTLYEICYLLYDVYIGLTSFIKGEILIIDKNLEKTALKQFRRIVEFFGESIPQLMLNVYMFCFNIKVSPFDLYLSIAVSTLHLVLNLYKLAKEAKYNGLSFAQYSISVLHLGMFKSDHSFIVCVCSWFFFFFFTGRLSNHFFVRCNSDCQIGATIGCHS